MWTCAMLPPSALPSPGIEERRSPKPRAPDLPAYQPIYPICVGPPILCYERRRVTPSNVSCYSRIEQFLGAIWPILTGEKIAGPAQRFNFDQTAILIITNIDNPLLPKLSNLVEDEDMSSFHATGAPHQLVTPGVTILQVEETIMSKNKSTLNFHSVLETPTKHICTEVHDPKL